MMDNIYGERFYGHKYPAWHKLGIVNSDEQTAGDTLGMLTPYWIEKRPVTLELNGRLVETGDFALVRSSVPDDVGERVFGYVTKQYTPLQPLDLAELFDDKVGEPVETMGMLGKGERMFLTWKLPSFDVRENDEVQLFGFLATGFDGKMGAYLNVTSIRVVCQNTWQAAFAEGKNKKAKGRGTVFSGKHTQKDLPYRYGEWMGYVQEEASNQVQLVSSFFRLLANTPVQSDTVVQDILWEAFPNREVPEYYPGTLLDDKTASVEKHNDTMAQYRDGITEVFQGAGTDITPDLWGVFNATTEYFNWGQMAKKPVEASILMGNRSRNMNRVTKVLQERLK